MAVERIDPGSEDVFNYPYLLHVPERYTGERPILVEPPNTAQPSDAFEDHLDEAQRRASGGFGCRLADELGLPFLHPVFPRPVSDPVDWTHAIQQLCARTMQITAGPLERIDRQLVAMIDDVRDRLSDQPNPIPDRVFLNGFSASGSFANRFSVLHPDRVLAVSAGGINGMVTLPIETTDPPRDLPFAAAIPPNYPVGVADLASLTGKPFDASAFREVRQFVYLGEDDDNDTLLWPDVWTEPELRASAILTYGPDIHDERFPRCAASYADHGVPAIFRTYPNTGHDPNPAVEDIVRFHEGVIAGDGVDALNERLGGNPVPVE